MLTKRSEWLALAVLIIAAYANSIGVPFYLDDYSSIVENPVITGTATLTDIWALSPFRFVTHLSFKLNYLLQGLNVSGYHLFNIAVHLLASIAVLELTRLLVNLSPDYGQPGKTPATLTSYLPIIAAALFAAHPLQTQAVTYVVQRAAALAALFYLAAIVAYIMARTAENAKSAMLLWGGFAVLVGLGLFSKQTAYSLPLALVWVELLFINKQTAPGKPRALPVMLLLLAITIAIGAVALSMGGGFTLEQASRLTQETDVYSRTEYLATQAQVLWLYIKLFLVPVGLRFDYDFPLVTSILDLQSLFAFAGHAALVACAIYLRKTRPLIAFGILFYYSAHIVESSVLPIRDLVFEHRTYLPNAGLILIVAGALSELETRFPERGKSLFWGSVAIVVLLGIATVQRNQVWRNPFDLFTDNVQLAPNHYRPWAKLSALYLATNQPEKALVALSRAKDAHNKYNILPHKFLIEANIPIAMAHAGQFDTSLVESSALLQSKGASLTPFVRSKLHALRCAINLAQNNRVEAENECLDAIREDPKNTDALINMASVLILNGRLNEAEHYLEQALSYAPGNADAVSNLQLIQSQKNR